jgi:hypothetical protein
MVQITEGHFSYNPVRSAGVTLSRVKTSLELRMQVVQLFRILSASVGPNKTGPVIGILVVVIADFPVVVPLVNSFWRLETRVPRSQGLRAIGEEAAQLADSVRLAHDSDLHAQSVQLSINPAFDANSGRRT